MSVALQRKFPVGAEPSNGSTHFRVWAPHRSRAAVVVEGEGAFDLEREVDGYFSGFIEGAGAGTCYQFRLDDSGRLCPDPASRFQPEGPHGPSQVIDASTFLWTDNGWNGIRIDGQVIYEMHIGNLLKKVRGKPRPLILTNWPKWASLFSRSCRLQIFRESLGGDMTE